MIGASGLKAWSVFGEIGLQGAEKAHRQLLAFDAAGKKTATGLLGLEGRAAAVAGGLSAVGVAAGAFAAYGTVAFAKFDAKMTESLAIMGEISGPQRKRMEDAARGVARTTTFSAERAAESYFYLASAGLDAEQSIAAMPQVAKFAQAGMFDMARATDLATDAQSALGLTVKDAQQNLANLTKVTDVLVKANTLANASVEQFSTALTSQAGPTLKAYNKSIEEGVAVLAALADQGIKAEVAGNGLSRVLRLLNQSALQNADAHRQLGFEVFNEAGKMRNLADIVENLEHILAGMSDKQKAATLDMLGFQARIQQVILPLIGTSDAIRRYEGDLRQAQGTTEEIADKQLDNLIAQLKLLKSGFTELAMTVGERLAPPIKRGVEDAIQELNTLIDLVKGVGVAWDETRSFLKSLGTPFSFSVTAGRDNPLAQADRMLAAAREQEREQEKALGTAQEMSRAAHAIAREYYKLPDSIRQVIQVGDEAREFLHLMYTENLTAEETLARIRERNLAVARRMAGAATEEELADQKALVDHQYAMGELSKQEYRDRLAVIRDLYDKLSEERMSLSEDVHDLDVELLDDFRRRLDEVAGSYENLLQVRRAMRMVPEDQAPTLGTDPVTPMLGITKRAARDASVTGVEWIDDVVNTMESRMVSRFKDMGEAAIDGLVRGLLSGDVQLKQVFNDILVSLVSMATRIFLFGSPSRLARGWGENIMIGFAQGMESQRAMLLGTAERALALPVPSLSTGPGPSAVANVGGGGLRLRVEMPDIPPPQDPRQAARDRVWQELWRESYLVAESDGFRGRGR